MKYITVEDRSIVSGLSEGTGTTSALTTEASDFDSLEFAKASLQTWLKQIRAAARDQTNEDRIDFPVIQEPLVPPKIQLSGSEWSAFQLYAKTFGVMVGRRQAGDALVEQENISYLIWVQLDMPPDEAVEHYYDRLRLKKLRERSSLIKNATARRQAAEEKEMKKKKESRTKRKSVLVSSASSSSSPSSSLPQPKLDGLSQRRMTMINRTKARNEVLLRREGENHLAPPPMNQRRMNMINKTKARNAVLRREGNMPAPQPKLDRLSQRRMNMINKTKARNEVLRRERERNTN